MKNVEIILARLFLNKQAIALQILRVANLKKSNKFAKEIILPIC
ncbi:MAG: hypothetical protein QNJ38_05430 [Prochloraceae cyanobacterium]|nr:hypothetical protein [Prochloraceae cyanobacterium]